MAYDPEIGLGRDESGHRWSGWPGAWCFYCGTEDADESAIGLIAIGLADDPPGNPPCPATLERKVEVDRAMNPREFEDA